jgi:hypothetical protein
VNAPRYLRRLLLAVQFAFHSRLGRRVGTVVLVTALFAAAVSALYDHPDAIALPARPAAAAGTTATAPPTTAGTRAGRPATPGEVAADWFARRSRVPRAKVKVLQEDRLAADRVRVLVMAELPGADRLDTALVTVRRERGAWVVR